MKELIVFDLDGVLINSRENMRKSWEAVKEKHQLDIPFESYFSQIGKPFKDILDDIGVLDNQDRIKRTYDDTSRENLGEIKPYPHVIDTLNTLSLKYKLAIVTSKSADRTTDILKSFPNFDYVCAPTEGLRGKPSGDQLKHTMEVCKSTPEKTLYVGDMIFDQLCAEDCGVDFYYASWGYGDIECKNNLKDFRDLLLV